MEKVGQIFRRSLIKTIKSGIENNKSVFVISYDAVSSSQMDSLRKDLKRLGAQMYVSKNRISRIALKELNHETLAAGLEGQTAFTWSNTDSAEVSKVLMKFTKVCAGFKVKGGLLDGTVLGQNDVQRLSDLPSRDVLRSQLLGTIVAPLTRLAYILNAKSCDLLSILKQLSEKKGGN